MRNLILIGLIALFATSDVFGYVCEIQGNLCIYKEVTLNESDTLPNDESYSSEITHVNFTGSTLYSIPSEIFDYFPNLGYLDVKEQNIQIVKKNTFKNAKNLVWIDLSYNDVEVLDRETFLGADKLEKLWLGSNTFGDKIDGVFDVLGPSLKLLSLHTNEIEVLSETVFEKLPNLVDIGLNDNKLEVLPANLFKNNLKLDSIWLDGNRLSFISRKMFSHLVNLDFLRLGGNKCINKNWHSNAYKTINDIENKLLKCYSNAHFEENLAKTLKEFEDKLSQKFDKFEQDFGSRLNNLEANFTNQFAVIQKLTKQVEEMKPVV